MARETTRTYTKGVDANGEAYVDITTTVVHTDVRTTRMTQAALDAEEAKDSSQATERKNIRTAVKSELDKV